MALTIRAARPGDGSGMARAWASAADYYADLDPEHFQRPQPGGVAESFEDSITRAGNDALLLVAELDGDVVGWLAARIQLPEEDAAAQRQQLLLGYQAAAWAFSQIFDSYPR
jgi:hypothetical protein